MRLIPRVIDRPRLPVHARPGIAGTAGHKATLLAAGFSAVDAAGLLIHLSGRVATTAAFDIAVALAAALRTAGWNPAVIRSSVDDFRNHANGHTGAEWGAIGAVLGADQSQETTLVARLAGWAPASTLQLAQAFRAGNPNNFLVASWVRLATQLGANLHAETAAFARIAGWSIEPVCTLAGNFLAANPLGFTAVQWATLASRVAADQHAQANALATMGGWNTFAEVDTLATNRAANNPNGFSVTEWIAIGAAMGNNTAASTTAFARVRGRGNTAWTAGPAALLAQAFAANAGGRTVAEWIAVANVIRADQDANVAAFTRVVWPQAAIITLATLFGNDSFNQTVAGWCAVAARMNLHQWAAYTARAMRFCGMGWPDQVMVISNAAHAVAVAWHLEGSNDGIVYRLTNTTNPHVTLHNLNESPDNWWYNGANFHVVTDDHDSPFDYNRRAPNQFHLPRQAPPPIPADVTAIANSFCGALGH